MFDLLTKKTQVGTGARFMHYSNFVRFRHILELSKFRNTRV